jgi:dTDP-4-amino-4,6-dideoxygalactose transaminase
LKIVEDCAQAQEVDLMGNTVVRTAMPGPSVFALKIMTLAGEGGMVLTSDRDVALKIAALRNVGYGHEYKDGMLKVTDKGTKVGYNMRLLEIQSALGIYKLANLHHEFQARRDAAQKISRIVQEIPWLRLYPEA